jgi:hypothetical protein
MQEYQLADSPEVLVYQVMVDQLLNNCKAPISRLVTWDGDVADDDRLQPHGLQVRLWPAEDPAAAAWVYPGAKTVRLTVGVEYIVGSPSIKDALNVWHAIRMAFYPTTLTEVQDLTARLQAAGCESGMIFFAQAPDLGEADPEVGRWYAVGKLAADVLISVSHQET